MHIRGVIQSTEITELTATADDTHTARAAIEAQVPDGYELLQVHSTMKRGGTATATGRIRNTHTRELNADGTSYEAARDALHTAIPEGWRLLHIISVEN